MPKEFTSTCPMCNERPKHVSRTGRMDGYCRDCSRTRAKESYERNRDLRAFRQTIIPAPAAAVPPRPMERGAGGEVSSLSPGVYRYCSSCHTPRANTAAYWRDAATFTCRVCEGTAPADPGRRGRRKASVLDSTPEGQPARVVVIDGDDRIIRIEGAIAGIGGRIGQVDEATLEHYRRNGYTISRAI